MPFLRVEACQTTQNVIQLTVYIERRLYQFRLVYASSTGE
nr:MAG TPA: hypothetical protein [Caudoviricetes sp.]